MFGTFPNPSSDYVLSFERRCQAGEPGHPPVARSSANPPGCCPVRRPPQLGRQRSKVNNVKNLFALLRACWPTLRRTEAALRLLDKRLSRKPRRRPWVEVLEDRTGPAAVLTATLDAQTSVALQPGDTIHYLVNISNTGDADALNTALAITLDPNAPEPGASDSTLRIGPLARRDTYASVGNTPLTVSAAAGLKANDFDIDSLTPTASLVVTAETNKATSAGGSVTINADGSFTYTPQTG